MPMAEGSGAAADRRRQLQALQVPAPLEHRAPGHAEANDPTRRRGGGCLDPLHHDPILRLPRSILNEMSVINRACPRRQGGAVTCPKPPRTQQPHPSSRPPLPSSLPGSRDRGQGKATPNNQTTPEPNPKVKKGLTFQALRQLQANPNLSQRQLAPIGERALGISLARLLNIHPPPGLALAATGRAQRQGRGHLQRGPDCPRRARLAPCHHGLGGQVVRTEVSRRRLT